MANPTYEIGRFVTLRNPQMPSTKNSELYFVRYNLAEDAISLYDKLLTTQNDNRLTTTQKRTKIIADAKLYLASDDAVKMANLPKTLTTLTDKLREKRDSITASLLNEDLIPQWENIQASSPSAREIWDTLIAYQVVAKYDIVIPHLKTVLLMLHLKAKMTTTTTDKEAKRMVQAAILLPNTLFPLPIEELKEALPIVTPPDPVDRAPNKAQRLKYQVALAEIERVFKRKRRQSRPQTQEGDNIYSLNDLTQAIVSNLSTSTQAVLTELAWVRFRRDVTKRLLL